MLPYQEITKMINEYMRNNDFEGQNFYEDEARKYRALQRTKAVAQVRQVNRNAKQNTSVANNKTVIKNIKRAIDNEDCGDSLECYREKWVNHIEKNDRARGPGRAGRAGRAGRTGKGSRKASRKGSKKGSVKTKKSRK